MPASTETIQKGSHIESGLRAEREKKNDMSHLVDVCRHSERLPHRRLLRLLAAHEQTFKIGYSVTHARARLQFKCHIV